MARKTKEDAFITRQRIINVAIREFSTQGFSSTSLADIASAAGVTRGAIYWHFKNKEELFNEIWQQSAHYSLYISEKIHSKNKDNPLKALQETLTYILRAAVSDPQQKSLMKIMFHQCEFTKEMTSRSEIRRMVYFEEERLSDNLKRCVTLNQLPSKLNIEQSVIIIRAYMSGLIENWLLCSENYDLNSNASGLVDNLITLLKIQ
ncbi:MAG: TetR family transcriptional regulator [Hafnia sp.]|jgi:TetR/AcrR family acrAB operon transcriptional repressor|uniref:TetR family transcriptional regulator n=1 Tax=Hafnia TaxID=568 RepID=UPI000BB56F24|nr:TetR family transcriptional regulator [Hafnia paralvei]MCE9947420.1 TetR family transcriptional regulator [Hafnia paralvei]PNK69435.1 DNA-binding transcriptional repressor AcrR [Hafnia paralvei]TBM05428.1 TetR family transcriptional regulator [Hafnia paralvei]TBM31212.1 TetR family transcriptional regulator [Hafnia paralvei]UBM42092.1 TetR family transcriptional regulator [Hafnia paralvei]